MNDSIKEFTTEDGDVLKIYNDSSDSSPREWDNLAKMIFTNKQQHLGDKHNVDFNGRRFFTREDFIERGVLCIKEVYPNAVIIKAVHTYEHSGASISTSFEYPYNCRWDSGTIGFAIVTKEDIRKNWGIRNVTKKYIKQAETILDGEVETLNDYISGNVFGFVHEDKDEEYVDSCFGFYGDDLTTNGILDHVDEKFHQLIKDD